MTGVNNILDKFGASVTKQAKINVGSSKNLNGGKRIDSTGTLRKSLKYKVKETEKGFILTFEMEDYGELRDSGQLGKNRKILKGWNKSIFKRGKGFTNLAPPVKAIDKWIKDKPIRLRDLRTGSFIEATASRKKSLSFLIGRKIKEEGIVPGLFFSSAWDKQFTDLPEDVAEGFAEQIDKLME